MCFELDKVSVVVHNAGARVRIFPNVAQCSTEYTKDLKKFFIRPEDTLVYEPYVDTYEFFGEDRKLCTYLRIYKEHQEWFGLLNEIIIGFNSDLDNRFIIPRFPEMRLRCGKRCLKDGTCKICDRIEELSKSLEKLGVVIQTKKGKNEKEDEINGEGNSI